MQQHMGQLDQEIKNMENQLYTRERERDKALDELRGMKKLAQSANQEIQNREKTIASLKLQLEKAKGLELMMAERDSAMEKIKLNLEKTRASLKESERRARDLEIEVETGKESGTKMFESLVESKAEIASLKASSLAEETNSLRSKLKLAMLAEETSKKALEDLAMALKEVATEANQVREELGLAKAELEHSRSEEKRLALIIKSNDEKYRRLMEEAKKEAEMYKNTAERLRLEAEETLLTWNDKETGFVDCLRKADEERVSAQEENCRLVRLVSEAESNTMKQRDIMKQALNESNTAKEAAEIARLENSQLKERLAEKDEALVFITRENENFRLNEAAALENIKELKRLLFEVENKRSNEQKGSTNKIGKALSFNLMDYKSQNINKDHENPLDQEDCDPIDEALRGSIFNVSRDSINHQRKKSLSAFGGNDEIDEQVKLEGMDGNDETRLRDLESDKSIRKKRALLRRFGDFLIKKKSSQDRRNHLS